MKRRLKSYATWAFAAFGFLGLVLLVGERGEPPIPLSVHEAVLKSDLRIMRDAIDDYTLDNQHPPRSLQDLVDASYIRAVPVDPITHKRDWALDYEGPIFGDPVLSPELKAEGLVDMHSNSNQVSMDGSRYKSW